MVKALTIWIALFFYLHGVSFEIYFNFTLPAIISSVCVVYTPQNNPLHIS